MKLITKHHQAIEKGKSGLLGRSPDYVLFTLIAKLYITEEEAAEIKKYDLSHYTLGSHKVERKGVKEKIELGIDELKEGYKLSDKNIFELFDFQKSLKEDCESLKAHLNTRSRFGGDYEFDF